MVMLKTLATFITKVFTVNDSEDMQTIDKSPEAMLIDSDDNSQDKDWRGSRRRDSQTLRQVEKSRYSDNSGKQRGSLTTAINDISKHFCERSSQIKAEPMEDECDIDNYIHSQVSFGLGDKDENSAHSKFYKTHPDTEQPQSENVKNGSSTKKCKSIRDEQMTEEILKILPLFNERIAKDQLSESEATEEINLLIDAEPEIIPRTGDNSCPETLCDDTSAILALFVDQRQNSDTASAVGDEGEENSPEVDNDTENAQHEDAYVSREDSQIVSEDLVSEDETSSANCSPLSDRLASDEEYFCSDFFKTVDCPLLENTSESEDEDLLTASSKAGEQEENIPCESLGIKQGSCENSKISENILTNYLEISKDEEIKIGQEIPMNGEQLPEIEEDEDDPGELSLFSPLDNHYEGDLAKEEAEKLSLMVPSVSSNDEEELMIRKNDNTFNESNSTVSSLSPSASSVSSDDEELVEIENKNSARNEDHLSNLDSSGTLNTSEFLKIMRDQTSTPCIPIAKKRKLEQADDIQRNQIAKVPCLVEGDRDGHVRSNEVHPIEGVNVNESEAMPMLLKAMSIDESDTSTKESSAASEMNIRSNDVGDSLESSPRLSSNSKLKAKKKFRKSFFVKRTKNVLPNSPTGFVKNIRKSTNVKKSPTSPRKATRNLINSSVKSSKVICDNVSNSQKRRFAHRPDSSNEENNSDIQTKSSTDKNKKKKKKKKHKLYSRCDSTENLIRILSDGTNENSEEKSSCAKCETSETVNRFIAKKPQSLFNPEALDALKEVVGQHKARKIVDIRTILPASCFQPKMLANNDSPLISSTDVSTSPSISAEFNNIQQESTENADSPWSDTEFNGIQVINSEEVKIMQLIEIVPQEVQLQASQISELPLRVLHEALTQASNWTANIPLVESQENVEAEVPSQDEETLSPPVQCQSNILTNDNSNEEVSELSKKLSIQPHELRTDEVKNSKEGSSEHLKFNIDERTINDSDSSSDLELSANRKENQLSDPNGLTAPRKSFENNKSPRNFALVSKDNQPVLPKNSNELKNPIVVDESLNSSQASDEESVFLTPQRRNKPRNTFVIEDSSRNDHSDSDDESVVGCSKLTASHSSEDSDYQSLEGQPLDGCSQHQYAPKTIKLKSTKPKGAKRKTKINKAEVTTEEGARSSEAFHLLPKSSDNNTNDKITKGQGKATYEVMKTLADELQTRELPNSKITDPEGLRCGITLHSHQKHALVWMLWRENCTPPGGIIADDMGLGKTIQTIALILATRDDDETVREKKLTKMNKHSKLPGGTLIVCPTNVVTQWHEEIMLKTKRRMLNINKFHQEKELKKHILAEYDIIITTYETLMRNVKRAGVLSGIHWRRVVLDEAHKIRNPQAEMSKAVASLDADKRWVLSGTPVNNGISDFFAIFRFLKLEAFDDFSKFNKCINNDSAYGMKRLTKILAAIMLRRKKTDVKRELFSKKEILIHKIELSSEERAAYDCLMKRSKQQLLVKLNNRQVSQRLLAQRGMIMQSSFVLSLIIRLKQICVHPCLIWKSLDLETLANVQADQQTMNNEINSPKEIFDCEEKSDDEIRPDQPIFDINKESTKLKFVLKKIQEIVATEDKVIVISGFVQVLEIISWHLNRAPAWKHGFYTGKLKQIERVKILKRFNDVDDFKILLLSLKAGGLGLNLMVANHVVIVDPHWNPQLELQAQDRAYRLGQMKDVFIHKFICANTIEENILELQEKKLKIANDAMDHSSGSNAELDDAELRFLFDLA